MVTASDIIRHQRGNVLFIIGELSKAENLYELTRLVRVKILERKNRPCNRRRKRPWLRLGC